MLAQFKLRRVFASKTFDEEVDVDLGNTMSCAELTLIFTSLAGRSFRSTLSRRQLQCAMIASVETQSSN